MNEVSIGSKHKQIVVLVANCGLKCFNRPSYRDIPLSTVLFDYRRHRPHLRRAAVEPEAEPRQ